MTSSSILKPTPLKRPPDEEVWKKFIDPSHWDDALKQFPDEPWRFFLQPAGQHPSLAWERFKQALDWIWDRAQTPLNLQSIVTINSLLLRGVPDQGLQIIRNYQPIFNFNEFRVLSGVFRDGSVYYENQDGLNIRVEGFWPKGKSSLEFFCVCRDLKQINPNTHRSAWEGASRRLNALLYSCLDEKVSEWGVYFLTNPAEIKAQLSAIMRWYECGVDRIHAAYSMYSPEYQDAVLELAVKMQRYIDITQFSVDASGRTSKLVQDYIFIQFGIQPPDPVFFSFNGRAWVHGTYLPLIEALRMARTGLKRVDA